MPVSLFRLGYSTAQDCGYCLARVIAYITYVSVIAAQTIERVTFKLQFFRALESSVWYFVASFSLVQFMLLVVQKITEDTIIPVLLTKIEDVQVQNFPSRSSILPS